VNSSELKREVAVKVMPDAFSRDWIVLIVSSGKLKLHK